MHHSTVAGIALVCVLLGGCGGNHSASSPTEAAEHPATTYTDKQHGFIIPLAADVTVRHDFQRSYFSDGSWKAYASPDSKGQPLLALVLDGSDAVTSAELRIGVSTDASAVAHCRDAPAQANTSETSTQELAGVPFTRFRAGDAGMSHYLDVEGYRTVQHGRCYAIDLWIAGTNPQVYDPPATPPFSRGDAIRRLRELLGGFRFLPRK